MGEIEWKTPTCNDNDGYIGGSAYNDLHDHHHAVPSHYCLTLEPKGKATDSMSLNLEHLWLSLMLGTSNVYCN